MTRITFGCAGDVLMAARLAMEKAARGRKRVTNRTSAWGRVVIVGEVDLGLRGIKRESRPLACDRFVNVLQSGEVRIRSRTQDGVIVTAALRHFVAGYLKPTLYFVLGIGPAAA